MSVVALIPARQGSKRLPDKNILPLNGHPLLAYAINGAIKSDIFERVIVSTDSYEYGSIAEQYGAEWIERSQEASTDQATDYQWVHETLSAIGAYTYFAILRPTNPFRTADMIQEGWALFVTSHGADSLRAIQRVSEHPCKMWQFSLASNNRLSIQPYMEVSRQQRLYDNPTQSLEPVYVQNASLQFGKSINVFKGQTVTGQRVIAYETQGYEGFDVNTQNDYILAQELVRLGKVRLPEIKGA